MAGTLELIKEVLGITSVGGTKVKGTLSKSVIDNAPFTKVHQYMRLKDGRLRAYMRVAPLNQENLNLDELKSIVSVLQEMFNAEPGAIQVKASSEPQHIEAHLDYVQEVKEETSSAYWFDRIEYYEKYVQSKKSFSKSQKKYYLIIRSEIIDKEDAKKDLMSKIEIVKEKFESADMAIRELSDDEVRKLFYQKMNPRTSLIQTYEADFTDSELFPSYMHDGNTYIEADETYFRQYFITKYPQGKNRPGWFNEMMDKGNIEVDIFCLPADPEVLINNISNSIQQQRDLKDRKKAPREQSEINRKIKSQERMLSEIYDNKGYEVTVVITIYDQSLEKLEKRARNVELTIRSSQLRGKLLARRSFNPFYYYLPLCYTDDLLKKYSFPMHSRTLASMLPYNASEITSKKGVVFGVNPNNDSFIIIDRFNRDEYNNGNGVTFGASGVGKTYAIQTEIDRSIALNTVDRTVVIDPEREYVFPYGQRIEFQVGGKDCTNPFHLRSIILDSDSKTKDGLSHAGWKMLQQTSDLVSWLRWIHPEMSVQEGSKVSKVIRECYAYHGIQETTESLPGGYESPTLLTLEKFGRIEGLDNLIDILNPYIHGEYRSLFCGQTNWNMNDKLTVLDIHNLQLGMQSPMYDLILKDIWAEFKKNRKEKTGLFCDEAHRLLNKNDIQTLVFIIHAFKQFRKYGSFIEIMTQQVGDIIAMGIQYAQQILANATFKKFLYLDSEWKNLLEIQKLSEKEIQVINRKTKKGRGIIIAGDTRSLFQSEATMDQLEFIDPEQYEKAQVS